MRVNSGFTGFFKSRLVVTSVIASVLLALFFIAPSFRDNSESDIKSKEVNLIIRQIGHRLLLQAGDLTSRVLPVTERKEGTFLLSFEKEFVFSHDSLMLMAQSLLPKTEYAAGYTVTVYDCRKGDIVYGFQINNIRPDILACNGRREPKGCYTIEFAFNNNVSGTKYLKSANIDSQASKTSVFGYPLIDVVYGGILLLFGITLLIWRFRKSSKPVPAQNQNSDIEKEYVSELPALGKFLFDVKNQRLLLGSEVISLTDKECHVLELLHKNFGELLPRETLMQEVWINEGVITGRSLDMFVSKLRKKLSGDPELRITNIHGKGYKLEMASGNWNKNQA